MSQPVHPAQDGHGSAGASPNTGDALVGYLDYDEPQGFDPPTPITLADAMRTPVIVEYGGMRKETLVGLDVALDRVASLMLEGFSVHGVRFVR